MDVDFRLFPEQASTMASRVDALFLFISGVSIFFTLLIALLLMTFAVRYRRRTEDYFPQPIIGSKALELFWTVIPLGIVTVMFFWGASIYLDMMRTPDNAIEVYVTGKQWMWHLQHANGERENNMLHVPVDRPVKLIMTSEDVLHDFYIPAFRVKMDVLPGKYTYTWFQATKTGTYHLFCALYCGTEHSRMVGQVVVMERAEYEEWLARKPDGSLAKQGRQLFSKLECITCHHAGAGGRAPLLEGLYNSLVTLDDGREVRADDTYIRESILYPSAKVRAGYKPIMPTFKGQITEDELIRILAFLKSLKRGETPPRVEETPAPAVEVTSDVKGKQKK
jgi:cytochrome c oxidase subunit 2